MGNHCLTMLIDTEVNYMLKRRSEMVENGFKCRTKVTSKETASSKRLTDIDWEKAGSQWSWRNQDEASHKMYLFLEYVDRIFAI